MKQIKLKKLNYYSPEIKTKARRIALIGIYISIALLIIAMLMINIGA
jgi:hypothetical protein